jgi:hypothetical protein
VRIVKSDVILIPVAVYPLRILRTVGRGSVVSSISAKQNVRWRTVPNRAPLHLRSRRISADASVVKAGVRTGGGDDGGGRCVSSGLSDMYRISTGCI